MEIPVINRISDFENGFSSLQNPSYLSKFFSLSGVEKINDVYSFWKWGAMILALLASFSAVINRVKILIIRLRLRHVDPSVSSQPLLDECDYDSDSDVSCSSSGEEEEEEDEEEEEVEEEEETSIWTYPRWIKNAEDFGTRDSGRNLDDQWRSSNIGLRRRRGSLGDLFSWSEIAASGKNVVKLWDNLGLGFRLDLGESSSGTVFSDHDERDYENVASFFTGKSGIVPAVAGTSPAVVLAGGESESGNVAFSAWDTRIPCRFPSILAEWRPMFGKIVGVGAGGVEKVYVRDDVSGGLTVGDMRKVKSPLEKLTESSVETWWDADAVNLTDESVDDDESIRPRNRR